MSAAWTCGWERPKSTSNSIPVLFWLFSMLAAIKQDAINPDAVTLIRHSHRSKPNFSLAF